MSPADRESESDAEPPRPFETASYTRLLQFPGIVPRAADASRTSGLPVVDAIVVPTNRSAERLRSALRLAKDARCQLVPLYTDSFPDDLTSVLERARPGVTPLSLPYGMRHEMLDLAARLPQPVMSCSARDISRKRNLGLLIGRICGWTRMLFLDDDIRMLNTGKLSAAFRDFCHEATGAQFWADILSQRSTVLDTIYRNLEQRYNKASSPLRAIEAAQWRRGELRPADFVSFTEKWLNSLVEWQARLSDLPRADSVMKALTELGLSHVVRAPEARGPGSRVAWTGTLRRALTRRGSPGAFRARRWPAVVRAADWAATQRPFERAMHGGLLSVSRRVSERIRGDGGG